ncbi:MAG: zf-HC2 domain-containing protein [Rhodothermales bacterium]
MNDCQHYEALIAEKLFGELSPDEKQRLEGHLETCPGCRAQVHEMEAALHLATSRTRPEPSADFWEGYYARLVGRLREEEQRPNRTSRLAEWLRAPGRLNLSALAPRWAYQLSGAVALLAVGVLIGWLVFGNTASQVPVMAEGPGVETPVQAASLEARADRYLDRSKVLLLGLVNLEEQDPALLNLTRQQEIARELIDESSALKDELTDANQRLLRVLIDDLEVILLQIANMEAGYDVPAIEMVKSGVDRRAILLKINLTEMRRAEAAVQPAVAPVLSPDSSSF